MSYSRISLSNFERVCQIQDLKNNKPQVIIGTPGRILALTKKNQLNLKNIQAFIIDECDKMLNALGK